MAYKLKLNANLRQQYHPVYHFFFAALTHTHVYILIRANKNISDVICYYKKMKEYERILKALANRRRLSIVALLKRRNEATVGDIAEHIKLSPTSTSKHLNILARADILDKRQQGLEVYYFLGEKIPMIIQSTITRL